MSCADLRRIDLRPATRIHPGRSTNAVPTKCVKTSYFTITANAGALQVQHDDEEQRPTHRVASRCSCRRHYSSGSQHIGHNRCVPTIRQNTSARNLRRSLAGLPSVSEPAEWRPGRQGRQRAWPAAAWRSRSRWYTLAASASVHGQPFRRRCACWTYESNSAFCPRKPFTSLSICLCSPAQRGRYVSQLAAATRRAPSKHYRTGGSAFAGR